MNIKNWFKKKELDLEKIYREHQFEFELLLIKDFTGYIPKEAKEPVLKMFKEYGEDFERWTLWQSWYVNSRAIHDSKKIVFYDGMMLYLKALNTMAKVNKKNFQPEAKKAQEEVVATSFLESALEGLNYFKNNVNNKSNKINQDTKGSEDVKV